MKKLLISMIATASLALVAQAGDYNFTSFEEYTGNGGVFQPTLDDTGAAGGAKFWHTESTDGVYNLIAVGESKGSIIRPKKFQGSVDNKALSIDTDKPLSRKINANGSATDVPTTGIYFDSMVQFTATDTAPVPGDEDKLIVWLYDNEEDEVQPELKITAAQLNDEGIPLKDPIIVSTMKYVEPNSWHRLTIAANLVVFDPDEDVNAVQFKVFLDSELIDTGSTTLYSLVSRQNYAIFDKITSVSFEGTGVVDDLVWTDSDPIQQPVDTYTLEVKDLSGLGMVASVQYKVGEGAVCDLSVTGGEFTVPAGTTPDVEFLVRLPSGLELKGGTKLSTDDMGASLWGKTVTIDQAQKNYIIEVALEKVIVGPTINGESLNDDNIATANSLSIIKLSSADGWTVEDSHKITNGSQTFIFSDYYKVTLDGVNVVLQLDPAKVTPIIGEVSEGGTIKKPIILSGDKVIINLTNKNNNLYYGILSSDNPTFVGENVVENWARGEDGEAQKGVVPVLQKDGSVKFYKVVVTDIKPQSASAAE